MLIVLFGLSGAGKNFVGRIFADYFHYHYWDADTAMPDEMKQTILKQENFTQTMRDTFTHIINLHIIQLSNQYPNVVISQALYKEKNRQQILNMHPKARMIHINASSDCIKQRLKKRGDWVNETYAEKISKDFEYPLNTNYRIDNNSNENSVIMQIETLRLIEPKFGS